MRRSGGGPAGAVVLVAGEAGIGKTVLVRAFAERAARRGPRRLEPLRRPRGAAAAGRRARPRAAGAPALREALRAGRRAEPLEAVREELAREPRRSGSSRTSTGPTARPSTHSFLGRRIEDLPALMVLTFRDDELAADHPCTRAGRAAAGGGAAPARAAALARRGRDPGRSAGRRPLRGDRRQRVLRHRGDRRGRRAAAARGAGRGAGSSGEAARGARRARPGGGRARRRRALAGARGRRSRRARRCEERGLLPVDGDVVRFRHELARRVIEDSLPGARRAELHARVLEALLALGRRSRAARAPRRRGGRPGETVELTLRAARAAAESRAHAEAAAHYARVLDHGELLDDGARGDVLEAFAVESYHGRPGRARARGLRRGRRAAPRGRRRDAAGRRPAPAVAAALVGERRRRRGDAGR